MNDLDKVTALVVSTIDAKKGEDLLILDMSKLGIFAERFVIATAQSQVHLRALAEEVERVLKEGMDRKPYSEGTRSQEWVLFEMAGVVLHLFTRQKRDFYALERLWADAPRLDVEEYLEAPVSVETIS
jgi:ribosome-associated protein